MKDIKDYKGTKTLIQVNNNEEYLKLMPLLNSIFSGWDDDIYIHNTEDSRSNIIYIDCYDDMVEETPLDGYEILQALDFLQSTFQVKIMQEKDVKKDNFYYAEYKPGDFAIIKPERDGKLYGSGVSGTNYYRQNGWSCDKNIREATKEERHHLECCIKENKFIPLEEALKSLNKFEIGKWYKVELNNKFNHFVKFKSVKNNKAYLDDLGYIADLRKWYHGTSIDLTDVTKLELLTDLSEIQQFLPSGHPDKLPTFKFNIGDIVNGKEGGWQYSNPESSGAVGFMSSYKEKWNSSIMFRKYANNTNWYKLSGVGNWITEEGLELVENQQTTTIPEYVELTEDSHWNIKKGAICKVIGEQTHDLWQLHHPFSSMRNNGMFFMLKNGCKPSTKEAYENQQLMNKHNLVVGKYYTFKNSSSNIIYWFRFKQIKDNYLYCSGYRSDYVSKIWEEWENKLVYIKDQVFKEVTEQEAKGIVEEKWIPKVGEWAYILGINHTKNNENFPEGKVFKISEVSYAKDGIYHIYVDKKQNPDNVRGTCTNTISSRKALPHEISNNTPDSSTQYWECIRGSTSSFTVGKIYKLNEGKTINDLGAFTDNLGNENGFGGNGGNLDYFKPSTEAAYNAQNQCVMYKGDLTQNYTYSNWKIAEDNSFVWKSTININTLNNPITITIKDRTKKEEKLLTKTRTKLTFLKPKSITI